MGTYCSFLCISVYFRVYSKYILIKYAHILNNSYQIFRIFRGVKYSEKK